MNKTSQALSWKQEVNERVAAHLSRRPKLADPSGPSLENRPAPKGRAALAAARVAARYANAPSFNETLADEARAALRAAQAASRAAQQAHAAAQSVLDGLEAASAGHAPWYSEHEAEDISAAPVEEQSAAPAEPLPFPQGPLTPAPSSADLQMEPAQPHSEFADPQPWAEMELSRYESHDPATAAYASPAGLSADEAAQPIYANLIQFPREVIATRKVRPRRIEGPLADDEPQLSIFEVDPAEITVQPAAPLADEPAAPTWMRPEWTAMELDANYADILPEELPTASRGLDLKLAPLSRHLLAIVVDFSLASAVVVALAAFVLRHLHTMPTPRAAAVSAAFLGLLIAAAYLCLSLEYLRATPGMKYAGIELRTFEGKSPSRAQCYQRLATLPLSVLPLGLGLAWALFDEENLTWHDRLSRTFLRKR